MPGRPSLPAIPELLESAPDRAMVVMTMNDDPAFARQALAPRCQRICPQGGGGGRARRRRARGRRRRTYLNPRLGARLATAPPPARTPDATDGGDRSSRRLDFAGHRIDAVAGRGGMGVVYRATDLALDRPVALKLLAPGLARDRVFRARFERECRLAAALDHPNVVPIFHAGTERGALYLTMRYVEGTDLRALLAEEQRLEPRRAAWIVAQVAAALTEAHARGLVHRDVKPANILIATRDGSEHAFLTDFGITMERGTRESHQDRLRGRHRRLHVARAGRGTEVDARADIYALGCVLYRALTGAVLYDKDSDVEKMWAHIHEPPPDLLDVRPELPASLGDVVERALAKVPADRQQTAGELAHELLAAVVRRSPNRPERVRRPSRRSPTSGEAVRAARSTFENVVPWAAGRTGGRWRRPRAGSGRRACAGCARRARWRS